MTDMAQQQQQQQPDVDNSVTSVSGNMPTPAARPHNNHSVVDTSGDDLRKDLEGLRDADLRLLTSDPAQEDRVLDFSATGQTVEPGGLQSLVTKLTDGVGTITLTFKEQDNGGLPSKVTIHVDTPPLTQEAAQLLVQTFPADLDPAAVPEALSKALVVLAKFDALRGVELENISLENVSFVGADLTGAKLKNVTFSGCSFNHADFKDATLEGVTFDKAEFSHAKFDGAQVTNSKATLEFLDGVGPLPADLKVSLADASAIGLDLSNVKYLEAILIKNTELHKQGKFINQAMRNEVLDVIDGLYYDSKTTFVSSSASVTNEEVLKFLDSLSEEAATFPPTKTYTPEKLIDDLKESIAITTVSCTSTTEPETVVVAGKNGALTQVSFDKDKQTLRVEDYPEVTWNMGLESGRIADEILKQAKDLWVTPVVPEPAAEPSTVKRMSKRQNEPDYRWENGAEYRGEMLSGQPHGRGRATYLDGSVYEGAWNQGRRHGHGTLTEGATKYSGNWRNNRFWSGTKEVGTDVENFSKGRPNKLPR